MPVFYDVLSRNIKAARKTAGYTQEQAAEKMEMSTLNYGRLERGQRRASLEQLAEMAQVFGCSIFALLRGCFPIEISTVFNENDPGVFSEKMAALMNGCCEEEQEMIYEICRAVIYRKAMQKRKKE